MREQKLYICEHCGTQYKDKNEALKCESIHKGIKEIHNASYHAKGEFPDRIEIEFENGSRWWYKR